MEKCSRKCYCWFFWFPGRFGELAIEGTACVCGSCGAMTLQLCMITTVCPAATVQIRGICFFFRHVFVNDDDALCGGHLVRIIP